MGLPIAVTLDNRELWILLSLCGPGLVLGVEDPYVGWLSSEVEADGRTILQSLIDRGLAIKVSEGEIALEDNLAAILGACHHPDHSLIVQVQQAGDTQKRLFVHLTDGLAVQHSLLPDGQYQLVVVENRDELASRLLGPLADAKGSHSDRTFRLPEGALFHARKLCAQGQPDQAVESILAPGLPREQALALSRVLTGLTTSASFVLVANRDRAETQHVRGFSVLHGADQLWMAISGEDQVGQPQVELIPADGQMLRDRLAELLR